MAARDDAILVEEQIENQLYALHHVDGRSSTELASILGFETFIDHPARDARVVGEHWVYFEPAKAPFGEQREVDIRLVASDGTVEGTFSIDDVKPQAASFLPRSSQPLLTYDTPEHGNELWSIDIDNQHFELFADLSPGPASTNFGEFLDHEEWLYFTTSSDVETTVWRTQADRSPVAIGTIDSSIVSILTGVGDNVFLTSGNAAQTLWVANPSDGVVSLIESTEEITVQSSQHKLYFEMGESSNTWVSDGSQAGTVELPVGGEVFETDSYAYIQAEALMLSLIHI